MISRLTLDNFDKEIEKLQKKEEGFIKVGYSTCGIAAGADIVYKVLEEELAVKNINIDLIKCGCAGMCYAEPLVEVSIKGMPKVLYGRVDSKLVLKILRNHVIRGEILNSNVFLVRG